jgi:predicted ATPase
MRVALAAHDRVLAEAIESRGGWMFKHTGDGVCAAFSSPRAAVDAARDVQDRLGLPVRMGIATGEAELRDGDYFGPALNRAARVMDAGHGGQVLVAAATAALVGDAGLMPLGDHFLAGLRSAEQVFQADRGVHPPLRTSQVRRSNLPAELSAFVGREHEVAEVVAALGPARAVTLVGIGGVGKTRLGLRAAAELTTSFAEGVWLVPLAPLSDPASLVEVVAAALGVPERQGQPLVVTVTEHLRGRELLVVLDNCEHLGDAVALWATTILGACPDVRLLATSRRRLGVPGEHVVAVSPLRLPAVTATHADLLEAEAVQLFIERAMAAKSTFALTEVNAPAVGRLVRLLDGIPLAIELAAARVRSQSPAELADLFGRAGTPGGYEPLRRAIEWSHSLLSDAERTALRDASVFAGSFDRAAAEAVINMGPGVVDLLDALVDLSLIIAEDVDGTTRYRLLETIRQFAAEHLDASGEVAACRDRHALYYVEFAELANAGILGKEEALWTARALDELDNFRAVLGWVTARGDADLGLRLVDALQTGLTTPAVATVAWAIPVAEMDGARAHPLHPVVLAYAGMAHAGEGDFDAAQRCVVEAFVLADAARVSGSARRRMLFAAAWVASFVGDYERAGELSEQWLEAARSSGDLHQLMLALGVRGVNLIVTRRDPPRGRAMARELLDLAERAGSPSAMVLACLANGIGTLGEDPGAALALFDRGFQSALAVNNNNGAGICLSCQAWARYEQGDLHLAASLYSRALDLFRQGISPASGAWLGLAALLLEAVGDDEGSATLRGAPPVIAGRSVFIEVKERLATTEPALRARMGDAAFEFNQANGRTLGIDAALRFVSDHLADRYVL